MPAVNVVVLLGLLAVGCNFARSSDLTCAYRYLEHTKGKLNIDDNEEKYSIEPTGEVLPDNKSIVCPGRSNFCYSLWLQDPQNKSQISMLAQGCWESSGKFDCGFSECISTKKSPKALNNTRFCCCSGTFCNINVSDVYVPTTDDPEMMQPAIPFIEPVNYKPETIIIISVVCSLIVFVIIVVFGYRLWSGFHKQNPDSLHLMESSLLPQSTPSYDLSTLKLQEVIGRGRYGSVWKASLNDRTVAAKVYQTQHKQYYMNEKDIYTLPHFDHVSLPKFLGSEERLNGEGRTEYLIVLSYAPLGCLQDYLRSHVIDWNTLCKMSQSVAKGLAHLHIDIRKGDKIKPCVSHRDLNSRNILVKSDLSCFICDMGFAMKISGSRYYSQNGEEQHAETTSLTDVGTLRYMAPEVLEGAVNLRDCESSLKQIDVYALGLVLWEIMTRCEDLYQGLEVPEYRMPFEAEIGTHPTFEHMQVLISKNKARPLFSEMWKDSNQAVKSLKETIEECWDQDAEARLTSLCVDERLQELPVLWERHRINMAVTGVSPTVNPTSTQLTTMRNSSLLTNLPNYDVPPHSVLLVDLQNPRNQSRVSYHQTGDSSTSEATVETTVTTSPSEPFVSIAPETVTKKNANSQQLAPRATPVPLQPHQGRNPCIERNMNMEPLEELAISGNTLLEKGSKFKNSVHLNNNNNTTGSSNSRDVDVDNIFDVLQLTDNGESNLLVSNDVLSQSTRTCNPIPYVQNAVHGSLSTRPKQPNVPGNGQHYDQKVKKGPFGGKFDRKKNPSAPTERKSQNKIGKDWGLKSLFDRKRTSKHNPASDERKSENQQQQQNYQLQNGIHGLEKSNLHLKPEENKPVPTEVCLLRQNNNDLTQIITRPTNGLYKSLENGFIQNGSCRNAEVGVAHLTPTTLHNGQAPVIKHRSSASSMGSSNGLSNCHSESDLLSPKIDSKLKRPTTLPLKGHGFKGLSSEEIQAPVSGFQIRKPRIEMNGSQSEKAALLGQETSNEKRCKNGVENNEHVNAREKIVKRVKTPFKRKSGVFSVYDDRFMCAAGEHVGKLLSYEESLLQVRGCVSLPVDIDTVCSTTPNGIKDFTKNRASRVNEVNSTVPNGEINVGESDREKMLLKNGLVVTHWKGANCQFKPTDSGNDNMYQVSCL